LTALYRPRRVGSPNLKESTMKLAVLAVALASIPVAAQDASQVVFYTAQQIETDIRKTPANSGGESEINLIERTREHAGILLRRTQPGKAEVHVSEADVWYVIDGGCVLVTGGNVIAGAPESAGQIRGTGISGGNERKLAKGDFIRIPAGVPHWVKQIEGKEIVYIVVKYNDVK
jgi:mannose-6-phosphate isomerase-like protein (cupin superfamily)